MRFIFFSLILISDQLTKWVAVQRLDLGRPVEIVPGLFNFTLVHNPGVAFGMLADLPEGIRQIILTLISIFAVCVVIYLALTEARSDPRAKLAIYAILAGAIGNFLDRMQYNYVIDFIDVYAGQHHWPAFNIADSAISIGVVVLLFRMTFCIPKASVPALE